jgi:hypothetical protein
MPDSDREAKAQKVKSLIPTSANLLLCQSPNFRIDEK